MGCGLRPGDLAPSPPTDSELIQQFLDGRAGQLLEGNVTEYLADASPAAQELERPLATGAAAVPLVDVSFRLGPATDETNPLRNRRVELVYSLEGLPSDNTFRVPLVYDFAVVDDEWRVEKARAQGGAHLPVWASGPVLVSSSDHFLALHRPELEGPAQVLSDAEQARAQLNEKVPFPLEDTYLLVIAADDSQYRSMAGTSLGPVSPIAQVETSYEVTPDDIRVLARQMVINREKLYSSGQTLETLRHELGHFLLAQLTRPFTPAWASEAAAMYLAGTRPSHIWRSGIAERKFAGITIDRLTRASSLGEHGVSKEGTSLEYAYSAAAGWYLIENFGAEQFWGFYSSYSKYPAGDLYERLPDRTTDLTGQEPAGGAIEELAEQTTREALGEFFDLTPAALDARLLGWMARQ